MKSIVVATAMSLCVVSLAAVSSADILVMRDGRRVEGTVVAIASRTITFRHADGATRRYPTSEVYAPGKVSFIRSAATTATCQRLAQPWQAKYLVIDVSRLSTASDAPQRGQRSRLVETALASESAMLSAFSRCHPCLAVRDARSLRA